MFEVVKVGTEFLVNTETLSDQYLPRVIGLVGGGFVVTWTDSSRTLGDNSATSIKAQMFDASGAKQGSEFLANAETQGGQYRPTITGLANGGFVITWYSTSDTLGFSGGDIKAQVFTAGGAKLGSEFLVNTQTAGTQTMQTVTDLADGGFVVTWHDDSGTLGDSSGASIKAQVFSASGAKLGSEFLLNTQTANDQFDPSITGLANGGFVVTWTDNSGTLGDSSYSTKAQVFTAGGAKVGTEFLVNTQTAGEQVGPNVTGLVNGGFVVTWYDGSGTLGDASNESIKAQVFSADGTKVGSEFLVNTQTEGRQWLPTITGLASGGFVVTWWDTSDTLGDSSGGSIKAQVFNASGTKVGSEFLVNTQTANNQVNPTITDLANGSFVITWQDSSGTLGDSSSASIKAQVFSVGNLPVIGSNGGNASAALSVAENTAAVTTVSAADPDAGTTLAYSISGGADAALFQIDAASGALRFLAAPDFEAPADAGANNVYDVIVRVSDGTLSDTQALAVTITDEAGETINGTKRTDVLMGGALEDTLNGFEGTDVLDGRGGADRMLGGKGNDTYLVDNAGDAVVELAKEGNDLVMATVNHTLAANVEQLALSRGAGAISGTGNALNNIIDGNDAANTLSGLGGNDQLDGGAGNDRLMSGAGKDSLTGGAGADRFVFATLDPVRDTIVDFARGIDKVELAISGFAALTGFGTGIMSVGELTLGKKALTANDHLIYNSANGALYYDTDGNGSAKAVQIAQFAKGLVLDVGDFVLV